MLGFLVKIMFLSWTSANPWLSLRTWDVLRNNWHLMISFPCPGAMELQMESPARPSRMSLSKGNVRKESLSREKQNINSSSTSDSALQRLLSKQPEADVWPVQAGTNFPYLWLWRKTVWLLTWFINDIQLYR